MCWILNRDQQVKFDKLIVLTMTTNFGSHMQERHMQDPLELFEL